MPRPSFEFAAPATPTSAAGDALTARFRQGYAFDPLDAEIASYTGTTTDALSTARDDRALLSGGLVLGGEGVEQALHDAPSHSRKVQLTHRTLVGSQPA